MNSKSPIGVFDSGLGGISVLHTMHSLLPNENLIYLGDSKYNPYGTKTKEEITKRCVAICDELISHDVKAIVIACNTATSACVKLLREKYDVAESKNVTAKTADNSRTVPKHYAPARYSGRT